MLLIIGAFTIPQWMPERYGHHPSPAYWTAVLALSGSSLLQVTFALLLYLKAFPLAYSTKFAAIGLPCCVAAIATGVIGKKRGFETGRPLVGGFAGVLVWLVFVTIH